MSDLPAGTSVWAAAAVVGGATALWWFANRGSRDGHEAPKALGVGVVGGGCVGGGVVEILTARRDEWEVAGTPVRLVAVAVRDTTKSRDWELPDGARVVGDWREVVEDDDVDVVVEVMGGTTTAGDVVAAALAAGKHVVSANKALLALKLEGIEAAVSRANAAWSPRRGGAPLFLAYEAAVAGAVPVIRALQTSLLPDRIRSIAGILNGTTNFILSEMEATGAELAPMLKRAQELGYAEADPTADVGGFDAQQKLILLAKLAFGVTLTEAQVPTRGMMEVSSDDFELLRLLEDRTVRLVGVAETHFSGGAGDIDETQPTHTLTAFVSPCAVPRASSLGAATGPGNVVAVDAEQAGDLSFTGPGAGRFPTANSVVADVLAIRTGASRATARARARAAHPPSLFTCAGTCAAPFPRGSPRIPPRVASDSRMRVYIRATGSSDALSGSLTVVAAKHGIIDPSTAQLSERGTSIGAISARPVPFSAAETFVSALLGIDGISEAVVMPLFA